MKRRAAALLLLAGVAAESGAAATASGKHWRLSIDSIACDAGASLVTLGTRIDYVGPKGVVEAPVAQLVDGAGRAHPPKSLVWRSGGKALAELLSVGGLKNLQADHASGIELRFELRGADGELLFEFGDLRALAITRKRATGCAAFLKPGEVRVPPAPPPARAEGAAPSLRVYRGSYPCLGPSGAIPIVKAEYPPYLPHQLLVFGRGYLPGARQIDLPMGRAPAQSYAFSGAVDVMAIEAAARRAITADFPQYAGAKHFAFNWGAQKAASGNIAYSVGAYELRACPK
jgi:hypothetical protein